MSKDPKIGDTYWSTDDKKWRIKLKIVDVLPNSVIVDSGAWPLTVLIKEQLSKLQAVADDTL